MILSRRNFVQLAAAAGSAATGSLAQPPRRTRPNIVLILADDLGYGDLGCYGQRRIQTPHIDRLAAEGTRFTSAYAGSTVCAPSRCCLMTGLHTGHARTRGNLPIDLPLRPQDLTVTELLKQAGYRTALFGKWSLGQLGSTGYPTRKGFDEWFGFFSQLHAHNYYPEHLLHNEGSFLLKGNMGTQRREYASDLFTERALRFIDKQSAADPFFLHVCYTAPHANNEMGRDTQNGMEVPSDAPYTSESWPQPEKNFAAMITRMDADVGRILASLKSKGLDRDTLVIFTSDNGPHKEGGHSPSFFESSGPLRGIKRAMYEGGIRVPFVARWPGGTPAGRTTDMPIAFWDFLPTAAELAGVRSPAGLDGLSYAPALRGEAQKPHEHFYWEFHESGFDQAVRAGNWKAVRGNSAPGTELYDLTADISERNNIAAAHPDVVRRLEGLMNSSRTDSAEFPIRTPAQAKKSALPM